MAEVKKRFVIVVGYDLSSQADFALEQAIDIAKRHDEGCDLHVLGVLDDRIGLGSISNAKTDFEAAEKAQEVIRSVADKKLLESDCQSLNLYVHARIGPPAKEIVQLAQESEADLLVVGTHGRSGVGRWLLGSVAEKVVRYAGCPVLVARPSREHQPDDAAFQPEPACPACVAKREETNGAVWWCEQHSGTHLEPHVFTYDNHIAQTRPPYSPIS